MGNIIEAARSPPGGQAGKIAVIAGKLLVIAASFWYLSRQVDVGQVLAEAPSLDFRWTAYAVALVVLQIAVVGLRWRSILAGLSALNERTARGAMIAITAIGEFFAQVLPTVAGDGIRAWFLVRLGCSWRNAATSVVIDRGIGIGLLVALGFVILLMQPDLAALSGYREQALLVYGTLLLAGMLVLLLLPRTDALFGRRRYFHWIVALVADAHRVLLGPKCPSILMLGLLIHLLVIAVVWLVGRSLGLTLTVADATILFTIMVGVTIVPISINGWGLRELALVALLGHHGFAPEKALLFSICFGIVMAIGSMPGALVWLVYSARVSPGKGNEPLAAGDIG